MTDDLFSGPPRGEALLARYRDTTIRGHKFNWAFENGLPYPFIGRHAASEWIAQSPSTRCKNTHKPEQTRAMYATYESLNKGIVPEHLIK